MSNPLDVHVGDRLRQRRTLLGFSQEKLGDAVGLTFQQVQKYERGANRIGASRLFEFCRVLDVPPAYFFEDVPRGLNTVEGQVRRGLSDVGKPRPRRDPMTRRETLQLVRAFYRIPSPAVRKLLLDMVKACAEAGN